MTKSVDIFVASDQELTEFAGVLSELFTIELVPIKQGSAYEFRNGAIALTVQPNAYPDLADYRYHLAVTGDTYGIEMQRVKWREDWAIDFYQALKATGRYRLRRMSNAHER
jgi:hypothetical protein